MSVAALRGELLDQSLPLPRRFRALFSLRSVGGDASVAALLESLSEDPSALFKHEVAFALGQMRATGAVAALKATLRDEGEHGMVRHEAAEALGAIASEECLEALETASKDESRVVRETAELALQRLRHKRAADDEKTGDASVAASSKLGSAKEKLSAATASASDSASPYISVDPVPAAAPDVPLETLEATVADETAPMWDRYAAMFALRNRAAPARSAAVLGGVLAKSQSALLKHEVCYVLGQIQDRGVGSARDALKATLEDESEHPMVRHEAAEAIGSIAAPETEALLKKFATCDDRIVAESCEVALDIMESERSGAFVPLGQIEPQSVTAA